MFHFISYIFHHVSNSVGNFGLKKRIGRWHIEVKIYAFCMKAIAKWFCAKSFFYSRKRSSSYWCAFSWIFKDGGHNISGKTKVRCPCLASKKVEIKFVKMPQDSTKLLYILLWPVILTRKVCKVWNSIIFQENIQIGFVSKMWIDQV